MAKDDRIHLPSGQGGLTRFSEEYDSTFQLSPGVVMVMVVVVMIIIILLHYFGGKLF